MEQQTELLAQGRAGTYGKQPAGYRAFIPAPLPPDPPIQFEGGLQARLSTANLALGRLDGSIQTLPNPDLFVFMYVRKEAVLWRFCYDAYIRLFDEPGVDSEGTGA